MPDIVDRADYLLQIYANIIFPPKKSLVERAQNGF